MKVVENIMDAGRERRKSFADDLRRLADRFEEGSVVNVVIAYNDLDLPAYATSADFADHWRMLGAIEYMKMRALDEVGDHVCGV